MSRGGAGPVARPTLRLTALATSGCGFPVSGWATIPDTPTGCHLAPYPPPMPPMNERKRVNIKGILADPVLREEIVEGATDFICKVEGIRPHSLSPAAQAVLDAFLDTPGEVPMPMWDYGRDLAAALKAAADQVVPEQGCPIYGLTQKENERQQVRKKFLAIAAELEGAN